MKKPKAGKAYVFVRATPSGFEHTELRCYSDSAGFAADGYYHVIEFSKNPAGDALAALSELGFTELREAKTAGIVPVPWQPTPETFVLKSKLAVVQPAVPLDDPDAASRRQGRE